MRYVNLTSEEIAQATARGMEAKSIAGSRMVERDVVAPRMCQQLPAGMLSNKRSAWVATCMAVLSDERREAYMRQGWRPGQPAPYLPTERGTTALSLWDPRQSNQAYRLYHEPPFQYNLGVGNLGFAPPGDSGRWGTGSPDAVRTGTGQIAWSAREAQAFPEIPPFLLAIAANPRDRVGGYIKISDVNLLDFIESHKDLYAPASSSREAGSATGIWVNLERKSSGVVIAVPGGFASRVYPEVGGAVQVHIESGAVNSEAEQERLRQAKAEADRADAAYARAFAKKHPIKLLGYAVEDMFSFGSSTKSNFLENLIMNGGPDVASTVKMVKIGFVAVVGLGFVSLVVLPRLRARRSAV